MARARAGDGPALRPAPGPTCHGSMTSRPVLPVAVRRPASTSGAPEGPAVAQPTGDLDPVALDPLPTAAAEAVLPARQPAVDGSRSIGRPAGRPSRMAVKPGPWDSPPVSRRSRLIIADFPGRRMRPSVTHRPGRGTPCSSVISRSNRLEASRSSRASEPRIRRRGADPRRPRIRAPRDRGSAAPIPSRQARSGVEASGPCAASSRRVGEGVARNASGRRRDRTSSQVAPRRCQARGGRRAAG